MDKTVPQLRAGTRRDIDYGSPGGCPEAIKTISQNTMKPMQILTAILSLLLVSLGFADDKTATTYVVGMTGVT
jgi:hypothetical protein